MKKEVKSLTWAVLIGIIASLVSGLFYNANFVGTFPSVKFYPAPLLGVGRWGWIFPWLSRIVYPNAPLVIDWVNLIADAVIWTLAAFFVLNLIIKKKKKK